MSGVDIDAIAGRLDLDAVIDRIDMIAIVEEGSPRSTCWPSSASRPGDGVETVRGARMTGISVDDAISRGLERHLFRRRRQSTPSTPAGEAP